MFDSERHMLVDAPLQVVHMQRHVSVKGPADDPIRCNATRSISFGARASNSMGFFWVGSRLPLCPRVRCKMACFWKKMLQVSTYADLPFNRVIISPI